VVGESGRVKKSNFLKKVSSMVRRYDIVGAGIVNVCVYAPRKCVFLMGVVIAY